MGRNPTACPGPRPPGSGVVLLGCRIASVPPPTRAEALTLDRANPLSGFRARFVGLGDVAYLVGNSLGPLPMATNARLTRFTEAGWGQRKVEGWEEWLDLPTQVGDRLGHLVGAGPGQIGVGDSTSVQLYKLLVAGLDARPGASAVAMADDEFPTDRYVVDGVAGARRLDVCTVATDGADGPDGPISAEEVARTCADGTVGVVVASLVRYRTGAFADLAAVSAAAHAAGALVLWDLSHAVGAVPIDLDGSEVDLAEDGIVADHRAPDVVRLAAAPLHTRFVDLWDAVEGLRRALMG